MTLGLLSKIAAAAESLQYLMEHPSSSVVGDFDQKIDTILASLREANLTQTVGVAEELARFQSDTLRHHQPKGSLGSEGQTQLASIAATVRRALHNEANSKQTLILNTEAVAESLKNLPDALPYLTETQQMLRVETIRCLEVEAYRAAIVIAWNFAYDYVRKWVYSEHRDPFNQVLTTAYQRSGQPMYLAVNRYEDFWETKPLPGEWIVLETCDRAGLITGKPYDALCEHLRMRNDHAHPSFKTPSADLTKGYIAQLLQVITNPPFPTPVKNV